MLALNAPEQAREVIDSLLGGVLVDHLLFETTRGLQVSPLGRAILVILNDIGPGLNILPGLFATLEIILHGITTSLLIDGGGLIVALVLQLLLLQIKLAIVCATATS